MTLHKLSTSGKYSDLKLICQGEEFKVHKAVVCTQSPVIAAACDGPFVEAQTSTIQISEFDVETVRCMISFMYNEEYDECVEGLRTGKQNDPTAEEAEDTEDGSLIQEAESLNPDDLALAALDSKSISFKSSTEIHVKVNAIADYYNIPELRELANTKVKKFFGMKWCAEEFLSIFKQIFTSTSDKELHELARNLATEHIDELLERPVFLAAKVIDEEGLAIITKLNDTVRYVLKRNKELEALATSLSTALKTSEAGHNSTKSAIRASLKELKRRGECRNTNCSAQFTCHIDMEPDGDFTLRCDVCKCKHK